MNKTTNTTPPPPRSINTKLDNLIKNINLIIITAHGRSGSNFMQSLLDNHSNIMQFPSGNTNKYTYFFNKKQTINKNIEIFINNHKDFFISSNDLGDSGTECINIDIKVYSEILLDLVKQIKNINKKSFFILKYIALAKYLKKDIENIKYIFIHIHVYENHTKLFDELILDFPHLYFMAMVRDTREAWSSWKKLLAIRNRTPKYHFTEYVIHYLDSFAYLLIYLEKIGQSHVKIIDLNRLHAKNINAMKEIANWLKIEFEDSLTKSTFLGLKWWGNATDKIKLNTFDINKSKLAFNDKLPKEEILFHNYFFDKLYKALHYDLPHKNICDNTCFKELKNYFKSYIGLSKFETYLIKEIKTRQKAHYANKCRILSFLPLWLMHFLNMIKVFPIMTKRHFELYFLHINIKSLKQKKQKLNKLIGDTTLEKSTFI